MCKSDFKLENIEDRDSATRVAVPTNASIPAPFLGTGFMQAFKRSTSASHKQVFFECFTSQQ